MTSIDAKGRPPARAPGGVRVTCTDAAGHAVSLTVGREYLVLDPRPNDPPEMVRIADNTGEDYLYPRDLFRWPRPRLSEIAGAVYVTLRAAEEYARHEEVDVERARRELTALLPHARLLETAEGDRPALYRFRRQSLLDISARVQIEVPLDDAPDCTLAVVVGVSVREWNRSSGTKRRPNRGERGRPIKPR